MSTPEPRIYDLTRLSEDDIADLACIAADALDDRDHRQRNGGGAIVRDADQPLDDQGEPLRRITNIGEGYTLETGMATVPGHPRLTCMVRLTGPAGFIPILDRAVSMELALQNVLVCAVGQLTQSRTRRHTGPLAPPGDIPPPPEPADEGCPFAEAAAGAKAAPAPDNPADDPVPAVLRMLVRYIRTLHPDSGSVRDSLTDQVLANVSGNVRGQLDKD